MEYAVQAVRTPVKGQSWKRGDEDLDYSIEEYDIKSAISNKYKCEQIQEVVFL